MLKKKKKPHLNFASLPLLPCERDCKGILRNGWFDANTHATSNALQAGKENEINGSK